MSATEADLVEAEIAVLGGAMLEAAAADYSIACLRPGDFARSAHRSIFRAIVTLRRQWAESDPLAVREELRGAGTFEKAGGSEYLARIVDIVPTAANQRYWTERLLARRKLAAERELERGFDRERAEGGFQAAVAWLAHRGGLPATNRAAPSSPETGRRESAA
jgi:replicative DNA helicase